MVTWAPASLSAFTGSVSSDSSKPSVARTATRMSVNLDMMVLLQLNVCSMVWSIGALSASECCQCQECQEGQHLDPSTEERCRSNRQKHTAEEPNTYARKKTRTAAMGIPR